MRKARRSKKQVSKKLIRAIKKKKKAFADKSKKHAKQLRAMGIQPRKRKKALTVPNLCPFKEDLLKRALRNRLEEKAELERAKLEKKERKQQIQKAVTYAQKEKERGFVVPKSLKKTSWAYTSNVNELKLPKNDWERKRMYFKELNQVVSQSDVIIEVLDARDPNGCRSIDIERKILSGQSNLFDSGRKKLILLINKIDLIPQNILSLWMKILRREYPVIAFKASTQSQTRKLHSKMKYNKATLNQNNNNNNNSNSNSNSNDNEKKAVTNRCIGADALMSLLKNYARSNDKKQRITVGFIGYPNTGKSSIINSLKRTQAVGTASQPGFTTCLASVKLDNNIELIDSPGVLLNDNENESRLVLRNALKLQEINAVEACKAIIQVCSPVYIANIYNISKRELVAHLNKSNHKMNNNNNNNSNEMEYKFDENENESELIDGFLFALANKLNHVKRGGVADLKRTAKLIINDWHNGKIPYYVVPPKEALIEQNTEIKYVSEFSKEFDINALLDGNYKQAINSNNNNNNNSIDIEQNNPGFVTIQSERFGIAGFEEKDSNMMNDNNDNNNNNNYDEDEDLDLDLDMTNGKNKKDALSFSNHLANDPEISQCHSFLNS